MTAQEELFVGVLREATVHLELAALNLRRGLEASTVRPAFGVGSDREKCFAIANIAIALASFDLGIAREYAPRQAAIA